jgi:hypothetical protein
MDAHKEGPSVSRYKQRFHFGGRMGMGSPYREKAAVVTLASTVRLFLRLFVRQWARVWYSRLI